ncbi:helix-turn-helix domain-containing protein [Terrilactibacillus sp. BCM23-1]|uniref:Helix-turn-helix domain-containing protein n=1 Tax=Terrilactibacillus tamarindi TaxID=2599694 RepID=A0A6N8CT66_9BACI|nr:helix-turn-helix domain-containing protein [Terrilactibacillus tamarindi]MTT32910.1 helix-turn-helix domain-containing protein [Terrilactibacillus tamarindi]
MIKDIPTKQIELVKEKENIFNPNQRLFLETLTTFLTAQTALTEEDIRDLIERSKKVGAPDFAELLNSLSQSPQSNIARIPVQVAEKFFSASEIADICGVSVQSVRKECDKGNIKARRGIKNSWIIPASELENPICQRWIENKQAMWSRIEDAKKVLKDSDELINNLKDIEENRKH